MSGPPEAFALRDYAPIDVDEYARDETFQLVLGHQRSTLLQAW
jgi:hypothetical protein